MLEVVVPVTIGQVWFYFLVAVMLEGLAAYTWQYRSMPSAIWQVMLQASKGGWLICMVIASFSAGMYTKIFWYTIEKFLSVATTYVWLRMILAISGREKKVPAWLMTGLLWLTGLFELLMLTNPWHSWVWENFSLYNNQLMLSNMALSNVISFYSYGLISIALIISVRWVLESKGLRRWQALGITISPLFSIVGTILPYFLHFSFLSPVPLSFLMSGVWLTWAYYRWRIYSILPFAQQAVARHMIDGLLVVDDEDHIVAVNPAAEKIFSGLMPEMLGRPFQEVAELWPALKTLSQDKDLHVMEEAALPYKKACLWYQLQWIPLQNQQGYQLGNIVVLKDISRQKQDQEKLMEQQKALSVLSERNRLGRELHDSGAQVWNYFQTQLQNLQGLLGNQHYEQADECVERLIQVTREVNLDMRESIASLKSSPGGNLDFVSMLQEYRDWYEKNHGIRTTLQISPEVFMGAFGQVREVQLLRIIQEALTNIRKHAEAAAVEIRVESIQGSVIVTISDDGCGFDLAILAEKKGSYGLQIMKERAEEAGGQVEIASKPGEGTQIRVIFSGEREAADEVIEGTAGR